VAEVRDLVIWGNHSSTQFPDAYHATIGGRAAAEVIGDDAWLQGEFISTVQQRGAAIIAARGSSSAASAANAIVETVRNVAAPTGQIFSAAMPSPGPEGGYGVPEGIVFGYPLRGTEPGQIDIVQGISHDPWAAERIRATLDELLEERDAVRAVAA
jgi:malate dehydrogenase